VLDHLSNQHLYGLSNINMVINFIENLDGAKDIIVNSLSDLFYENNQYAYTIENNRELKINQKTYGNIIYVPKLNGISLTTIPEIVNNIYYQKNTDMILQQNKDKFVIVAVKYLPDNTKDVLYATSYVSILNDDEEYHKLLPSTSYNHYEILNYKTGKFEEVIEKNIAIEKLNEYANNFLAEYKSNIVKEFHSIEKFLEYIKVI